MQVKKISELDKGTLPYLAFKLDDRHPSSLAELVN